MRKKIVAGNWKMNCTPDEGTALTSSIIDIVNNEVTNGAEVVLIPPFVLIDRVRSLLGASDTVSVGAQNCHQEESGAYTGEVSAAMLASIGVDYVILGHSERREYFGETDELLSKKITHVLSKGLLPIYCCGERLESREAGDHEAVVGTQVEEALFGLSEAQIKEVVIAYEPVWAIGTGKTATAEQAQEMHQFIRSQIAAKFNQEVAESIAILYGGSVKPGNAQEIFAQPDVDGGLIGGASLKASDFTNIIKAFG